MGGLGVKGVEEGVEERVRVERILGERLEPYAKYVIIRDERERIIERRMGGGE